ncbi:MAG: tetratricopeptide repeat protein [Sulfuricaulis sp.]|uniref:tetratricopeptide repeat-containing sulfotransferase family protein n=1 Tax=Sulfuricaulis sp. TaxID=2003553 RepID=UPI0025CC741B|nr:tetratricopeptide repeat-containing sulfotransferase family protein [Sulfuricaulis sp.]MCR4347289.1 tetratricopeptide repeat protein [Sulfuricaulis sp.]
MPAHNVLTQSKKKRALDLARSNRLGEARALYAEVCTKDRSDAEAWFMLGAICGQMGLFDEAEQALRQAISLRPSAEAHDNLGMVMQAKGKFGEAVESHRQALRLRPDFARACFNLGHAYREMSDFASAAENFRQASRLQPDYFEAHANLGAALLQLQRFEEALPCFEEAARLNPGNAEIHRTLGNLYRQLGRGEQAVIALRRATQLQPQEIQGWTMLGNILLEQGNYREALAAYQLAQRLSPDDPEILNKTGHLHQYMGNLEEALDCFRQALKRNPRLIEAIAHLGNTLATLTRFDEARQCLESSLRDNPGEPRLLGVLANVYEKLGEPEKAHEVLRPLVEARVREPTAAVVFGNISKHVDRRDEAIQYIEELLRDTQISSADRQQMHFVAGKLYETGKKYDEAFEHYKKANEAVKQSYDPASQVRLVDALISTYTAEFMAGAPRASIVSDRPVFIVGMPRSGTTLVEQILASHPQVHGAGELMYLFDLAGELPGMLGTKELHPHCMKLINQPALDKLAQSYLGRLTTMSADAARVTDKLPSNFLLLGLIELLFPQARIIHCRRDPCDTCLSCYFQDFGARYAYSADLTHLGLYYREYHRLMQHWKKTIRLPMLEIRYEEMVDDQEAWSRKLVEFCGPPWDDRCLRFYESGRAVNTASYDQVRRPMYKTSAGRWRRYERHLGPLLAALGDLAKTGLQDESEKPNHDAALRPSP